MNRSRAQSGMTLVEVMVVISIIGIIAAIAVPSFRGMIPRMRLANTTQTLANSIAMARMAAISKSTEHSIVFDLPNNSFTLRQFTDDPTTTAVDYAWRTNSTTSLGGGIEFGSFTYVDATTETGPLYTLQINANGTTDVPLAKQSIRVVLQTEDGTIKKRVVVASTGRINSQRLRGTDDTIETNWIEE